MIQVNSSFVILHKTSQKTAARLRREMAGQSVLAKIGKGLAFLLLSPFIIVGVLLFLILWLIFTITCIGPFLQSLSASRDRKKLSACIRPSPRAVVDMVTLPRQGGRKVAVRWSQGTDATLPPICIPNGLGATLITIAKLHDMLEAKGYPVLSYDRGGVGLSEQLASGRATVRHSCAFCGRFFSRVFVKFALIDNHDSCKTTMML